MKNGLVFTALGLVSAVAFAAPITPTFTTFGTLAAATFGGTGIDNTAVAITTIGATAPLVTMGLSANQRFDSPAVTNNGAGIFTARAGVDSHPPSPADPYALWNFSFYVGGSGLANYTFELRYDFDPTAGNDASNHGVIRVPGSALTNPFQDTWNLGMDFLDIDNAVTGVTSPGFAGAFDPNAVGQYTFSISAFQGNVLAGTTAIQVNVTRADVPEPASLALVGLALLGLAASRRRNS